MARIAIDMTPALPGGENGGVKQLALELIKGLQNVSPEKNSLLILTAPWNDNELALFDEPETKRLCIAGLQERCCTDNVNSEVRLRTGLRRIYEILPIGVREKLPKDRLVHVVKKLEEVHGLIRVKQKNEFQPGRLLSQHNVDVLFCPFTAPTYAEPDIPVVSLVCDLQHRDYPQFFSPDEITTREAFFDKVKKRANAIICISESTRISVIKHLKVNPERTYAVPICIQSRLVGLNGAKMSQYLRQLHIDGRPYMFYPANFWPHKNHHMLVVAYAKYLSRNVNGMDLVFTGSLDHAQQSLKNKVMRMGLGKHVHFLGYLPEDQLAAVWKGCSFLIFPSLYEGFGIPVLEAMRFGKPVLCSNVTSLPEVAGDAALYFDPRKPMEILQCIERISEDRQCYNELVQKGYKNILRFKTQEMVNQYHKYIKQAVNS